MSFNQVKSLFELNIQKKGQELKELQEKYRLSLYSFHTEVRNLLMERPEIKLREKTILDTLKTLFRGRKFRINTRVLEYSYYPYPDYLRDLEYSPKAKNVHIHYTLDIEHEVNKNGYSGFQGGFEERSYFNMPFTGEFKRISLEWQDSYKKYSEIEPKFKKLHEFTANLDNNVNVFFLSNENPELYNEAESYISNILNL